MRLKFRGFTLVELLVVISIIGILSSITMMGIKAAREKSKVSKAKADISRISLAVVQKYADTRLYPGGKKSTDIIAGFVAIDISYGLASGATDPWSQAYKFSYNYTDPRGTRKHSAVLPIE